MVGNSNLVKLDRTKKQSREAGKNTQEKPKFQGKTWKRGEDKRSYYNQEAA